MRIRGLLVGVAVLVGMVLAAQADLINSGWETGYLDAMAGWTEFGTGGMGAETWAARTGTNGLAMAGWVVDGGLYQDVGSLGSSNYTFSVFGNKDASFTATSVQLKLEFLDGSFGMLSASTTTVSGAGAEWSAYSVNGTSPAGTAYVRPVMTYAGASAGGAFKWDDAAISSTAIPEPTSAVLALLGFGLVAFVRRRTR